MPLKDRSDNMSIRNLSHSSVFPGIVLLVASLTGLCIANSPIAGLLDKSLAYPVLDSVFGLRLTLSAARLINEGLMTLFFLGVTLEIKKEMTVGHLATVKSAALPAIGAVGGMLAPAAIYWLSTRHSSPAMQGWAIPIATDAAFTLPIVASMGTRISRGLRGFVMALAVFDDVLAILIIALFYSAHLSIIALLCAGVMLAILIWLNRTGVERLSAYGVVGVLLWMCLLQSGVHATLAGVLLGLCVPSGSANQANAKTLALQRMERAIQPYVALLVLPVFGLVNLAVRIPDLNALISPVGLGIAAGLFFGKQIGVFSFVYVAWKLGWSRLPGGTNVVSLYGVALLCGIGFTISLFISELSFRDDSLVAQAKLGVLLGSTLSAIMGVTWLLMLTPRTTQA